MLRRVRLSVMMTASDIGRDGISLLGADSATD